MEFSSFSEASSSRKHLKSCMFGSFSKKGFQRDQSRTTDDLEWINRITECPVYHPAIEDFEDPLEYLQKIAPEASKYGVCKIVPPLTSGAPTGVVMKKEKPGFRFTPKVQPLRIARWTMDDKNTFFIGRKSYTLRDFEVMANRVTANKYCLSGCLPSAYLEREFWVEMMHGKKGTVEYGVNVDGSAFSSSSNDHLGNSKWNLKKLPRLPRSALRLVENPVPGVTDPMLYIGMLFSMFAWHVEDHYLYSINYHHCGAPKTWYGVPGSAAHEFEKVIRRHVYTREILPTDGGNGAFELLAEKTTMFPPKILLQNRIPVYKVVQSPGEFVITFPRAYHAGFSHGFNCGEAVNFAAHDWFPFGGAANERYALLRKKPIIPYEEILCKEAMILSSKTRKDDTCDPDAVSERFIKISFTSLIRKHDCALLWLKSLDRSLRIASNLEETISCSLCKQDCYVANVICNCYVDPICVFHAHITDTELFKCGCRSDRFLSVRRDLPKMKDVAKKFEEEEKLIRGAEKRTKHDNCVSPGCNRHRKGQDTSDRIRYVDTKIQHSKVCGKEGSRCRKLKTFCGKNIAKVDVATPVNKRGTRGKIGISPTWKERRSSGRLKELNKKYGKKASKCHLCCSKIAH
ncbi:lysine-specific demethylase JMJ706-like [Cynara cardunculus var. scolymus]|uniref:lysine-specific demethylase JMJ706-like n=1 Tax=Cynara cardunculus var. scolymus TaxID=59895 RepID=UPI000D62B617|nr:lysine-specific demethylase JMJ706-like [Cynara cardunculus var. scolymus]